MKHLFWGIALLLATTAAAQPQVKHLPVMHISDPDQYLELKHNPGTTVAFVPTTSTVQPHTSAQPGPNPGTDPNPITDPLPAYLLYDAMWSDLYPGKFIEEMGYLPLTPEHMKRLILEARVRAYTEEK